MRRPCQLSISSYGISSEEVSPDDVPVSPDDSERREARLFLRAKLLRSSSSSSSPPWPAPLLGFDSASLAAVAALRLPLFFLLLAPFLRRHLQHTGSKRQWSQAAQQRFVAPLRQHMLHCTYPSSSRFRSISRPHTWCTGNTTRVMKK